jgi:hypothetical protein
MSIGYWWETRRGERPLGRPRQRCVDNIRMDLGEIGWGGVNWIGLAQDRDRWRALVILQTQSQNCLDKGCIINQETLSKHFTVRYTSHKTSRETQIF